MTDPLTTIFFTYGLAFFCMGFALFLESSRSPFLTEGKVLLPLALFGLIHGSHEWLEMFLYSQPKPSNAAILVRLILLVISFSCLLLFGIRSFYPKARTITMLPILTVILVGFGCVLLIDHRLHIHQTFQISVGHVDALARYTLGFAGAIVGGAALVFHTVRARRVGRKKLGNSLILCSICFFIYGLTQFFVPPQDFFPANLLNASFFLDTFGLSVQIIRGGLATAILISLLWAVRLADEGRQKQLENALKSREEALEVAKSEMVKRENLQKELMRHIVIAQEDERARISRELHDETAQLLTAINLHLATLQLYTDKSSRVENQIRELKNLSQQMSEGIYRMVHDLRPAQLDDLGLVAALRDLIQDYNQNHGLEVNFQMNGTRKSLDSLIETVVFRVTQESLSNIVRHSGVLHASVKLEYGPEILDLEIKDEGEGFTPGRIFQSQGEFGITGMRERVEALGGSFAILSMPGQGTTVRAMIPFIQKEIPSPDSRGRTV
jgi:signal transduction histidine kinase